MIFAFNKYPNFMKGLIIFAFRILQFQYFMPCALKNHIYYACAFYNYNFFYAICTIYVQYFLIFANIIIYAILPCTIPMIYDMRIV